MTDKQALDFLVRKLGLKSAVADALDVSPQVLTNWYAREISASKRAAVWAMVNDNGGNLSRDWLMQRVA